MTPLAAILQARISRTGPITLADYMAECLLHPKHGYYSTADPFGTAGDFTTAPEISQMFGELIGLSLAQCWIDQGRPTPFTLAELGPGRGTLMADILRASAAVPGFREAAQVHLVEASAPLRARQAKAVPEATWHDDIAGLPQQATFLVANEFFDALPMRQFSRDAAGWREHMVGLDDAGALAFGKSSPAPIALLDHRLDDTQPGDVVEIMPALPAIGATIGDRITQNGGAALMIDYGDWRALGDTFQALRKHKQADPFADPGNADLTAHVDFEAIALAAHPACHTRLCTQGVFLERLGITQRAQALAKNMTDETLAQHIAAHRRLTHPAEMGNLFKVIGLYPADAAPPPGLTI